MIISHAFSLSYARMHRIKSEHTHTRSTIIMCMFSFYGQKRENERREEKKEKRERGKSHLNNERVMLLALL